MSAMLAKTFSVKRCFSAFDSIENYLRSTYGKEKRELFVNRASFGVDFKEKLIPTTRPFKNSRQCRWHSYNISDVQ